MTDARKKSNLWNAPLYKTNVGSSKISRKYFVAKIFSRGSLAAPETGNPLGLRGAAVLMQ